ncbi:MAG: hypothetical protein ACRDPA_13675 [Solirubrobacteraceae bacterium]
MPHRTNALNVLLLVAAVVVRVAVLEPGKPTSFALDEEVAMLARVFNEMLARPERRDVRPPVASSMRRKASGSGPPRSCTTRLARN